MVFSDFMILQMNNHTLEERPQQNKNMQEMNLSERRHLYFKLNFKNQIDQLGQLELSLLEFQHLASYSVRTESRLFCSYFQQCFIYEKSLHLQYIIFHRKKIMFIQKNYLQSMFRGHVRHIMSTFSDLSLRPYFLWIGILTMGHM